MEALCSDIVVRESLLSSTMEALVVEVSVTVAKSFACLLLMVGVAPNGILECRKQTRQLERPPIADHMEKQPVFENMDASETVEDDKDNDDKDDKDDDAGEEEEEFSGEEGDDGDEGNVEDDPQANGDGENEDDDNDDNDEDDDDDDDEDEEEEEDDEDEEEEEEEEEIPQPPAKRRK